MIVGHFAQCLRTEPFGVASRFVEAKSKAPALQIWKAGAFLLARRSLETTPNITLQSIGIVSDNHIKKLKRKN